jgi:hypothetical protein
MHRMHSACALNNAQYDLRCPICRQLHEGAQERPAKHTLLVHSASVAALRAHGGGVLASLLERLDATEGGAAADARRAMQTYRSRRSRAIRGDARLSELRGNAARTRRTSAETYRQLTATWASMQREAWRSDATINTLRRSYQNSRRQYNRWNQLLEEALLERVGLPPDQ